MEKTIVYDFAARALRAAWRRQPLQGGADPSRRRVRLARGPRAHRARSQRLAVDLAARRHARRFGRGGGRRDGLHLLERASDAEAARIAERENAADKAAGAEPKARAPGVADILFDLERRETRAYAHIFSRGLVDEWRGAARLNRNPERSAGFVVLKAPDFPRCWSSSAISPTPTTFAR